MVDASCSVAFANVYKSSMPIAAYDLLYERVLPFYDALSAPVGAVLTDNVLKQERSDNVGESIRVAARSAATLVWLLKYCAELRQS